MNNLKILINNLDVTIKIVGVISITSLICFLYFLDINHSNIIILSFLVVLISICIGFVVSILYLKILKPWTNRIERKHPKTLIFIIFLLFWIFLFFYYINNPIVSYPSIGLVFLSFWIGSFVFLGSVVLYKYIETKNTKKIEPNSFILDLKKELGLNCIINDIDYDLLKLVDVFSSEIKADDNQLKALFSFEEISEKNKIIWLGEVEDLYRFFMIVFDLPCKEERSKSGTFGYMKDFINYYFVDKDYNELNLNNSKFSENRTSYRLSKYDEKPTTENKKDLLDKFESYKEDFLAKLDCCK